MFDTKPRQQLESLRSTLRNFEQSVSGQAKGFHRLRSLLQSDIDAELKRMFPRQSSVEGYLRRYEPLARVAAELTGLLRQSQQLENELDGLLALFVKERQLADHGEACCRQWRDELRRLPAQCEREADLTLAKRELEQIGLAIRLHGEALRAFQEADAIVKGLGGSPETASLEVELSVLRQALAAGRVSLEGIRQLKKLSAPLDALLKQPTPQELQCLSSVLTEIRLWNSALNASTEQERGLEQRRRQLGMDWRRRDPDAAKALLAEAEALREQRIQQGLTLREHKRRELEEWLDDLARACGPQPDIRHALDTLKQAGFDSANRHKDWMDRFNEAEGLFKDTAKNHERALEQSLHECRAELEAHLLDLRELPMGGVLKRQAEELERQAETLAFPQQAQDLLKSLRCGYEWVRQIDELAEQARQDKLALDTAYSLLHEDYACLRVEADRLGYAVEPLDELAQGVESLELMVLNLGLDQAREWVDAQSARLERQRQDFIGYCQNLRNHRLADIDRHWQALREAGFPLDAAEPLAVPAANDPGAWADSLVVLEQDCLRVGEYVEQALERLGQRCLDLKESVLALDSETLSPVEREEAEGLLRELTIRADAPPLERLRGLAGVTAACEGFLDRLSADRQSWQSQLDVLKQGLQAFTQERLTAYCPEELFSRATDLAYGIPEPPQPIHRQQLHEAKILFDRLQRHAWRRAAQQVERQMAQLERHCHPQTEALEALLAEIHGLGDEQPVPVALRLRLQQACVALEDRLV